MPNASDILTVHASRMDAYLHEALARVCNTVPPRLMDAINYSLFAGGKRLRPGLLMETFASCSRDAQEASAQEASALAAAGAIELIHTFSLVHDDLPAMDDDDLRRGRPTLHKAFDEATAVLAGDAMTTLAFQLIATDAAPDLVPSLVNELAQASGPVGMIGGQMLDLAAEHQRVPLAQLQEIHRRKTGALLTSACRLGAIAARADEAMLVAITTFGMHMGLAFQIVDDVLDETATQEQMGKAVGKDAAAGKNTYPALLGLDESRRLAVQERDAAIAALSPLGTAGEGLAELVRFVVARTH